jgi:hypothetical protein
LRNSYRYLCGTPKNSCCGSLTPVGKNAHGAHSSPQEAFQCHKRYLISQGFEQVGSRDFKDPKTGYIRVLTKACRFGSKLRVGKNESNQTSKKIFDRIGGTIIST